VLESLSSVTGLSVLRKPAPLAAAATLKLVALTAGFAGTIPLWAVLGLGDDGSTLLAVATSFIALSRSIKG
jgi:hypothetical protein